MTFSLAWWIIRRMGQRPRHRRALFLRDMTERGLHGLALKLLRKHHTDEITEGEEWLYDQVMYELAWRMRRRPPQDRCTCQLCFEVFGPDYDSFWRPSGPESGS